MTKGSLRGVVGGLSDDVWIKGELHLIELSFRRAPFSDELYMSDGFGV